MEAYVRGIAENNHPIPSPPDPELRVATLDEIRQTALNRLFQANKSLVRREMRRRRWKEPKEGDLVLLRRFATDHYHGRKLEPRWEGPYRLADVALHGRFGRLLDLYSDKVVRIKASGLKARCHLDDFKVFMPRRSRGEDTGVDVVKFLDERRIRMQYGEINLSRGINFG